MTERKLRVNDRIGNVHSPSDMKGGGGGGDRTGLFKMFFVKVLQKKFMPIKSVAFICFKI